MPESTEKLNLAQAIKELERFYKNVGRPIQIVHEELRKIQLTEQSAGEIKRNLDEQLRSAQEALKETELEREKALAKRNKSLESMVETEAATKDLVCAAEDKSKAIIDEAKAQAESILSAARDGASRVQLETEKSLSGVKEAILTGKKELEAIKAATEEERQKYNEAYAARQGLLRKLSA